MITKVYSAIPHGYTGKLIEVETSINKGLPVFNIVGMGDKTIFESKDRVRNAIQNSDLSFPIHKTTVNLAPANLIKTGSSLDLPITISILVASRQLTPSDISQKIFVGELSLSGEIRPVYGIINIIETAKAAGFTEVFIPAENLYSASIIHGITLYPVSNLKQLFLHLKHQKLIPPATESALNPPIIPSRNAIQNTEPTFDDVYGLDFAKRAILLALAGHHNLLLVGPPGSGKTLLAKTIPSLLPPPSEEEILAIAKLHELSHSPSKNIIRPFRSHITVVPVAQLLVVATLLFQVKYLYHIVAFFFSMSSQNSLIKYLNHFVSLSKTIKSPSLGQKKKLPSPQILSSSLP